MEFRCEHCKKVVNVPDGKVPRSVVANGSAGKIFYVVRVGTLNIHRCEISPQPSSAS